MEHSTLCKWVSESEDATEEARAISERCRDYYDSKQLTAKEVSALRKRKQAPVVINRIKPKMDGLMGMERSNRTTAKAFARTPKHDKASEAATEAVRFVLQDNFYNQVRSAAWENMIIEGTGAVEVLVKPKGDDFKIALKHVPWDRLIVDPYCRAKTITEQNSRYLGQVIWMDYDDALQDFPDGTEVLETMFGSSTNTYDDKPEWIDTVRKRVKIVELYYRDGGDVYYSCFTLGGYLKEPKKSPYINEEGETEWPYEAGSVFVDREGQRYGAIKQLLDIQDEINARRSKALHLMSVRQVRWERGAVEDINKARQELAKPDGVIETTPGMEFEVLKTGDMAAAQFNLLTEAKSEIDAVGVNAALSGKDSRQMSGRALFQREATGQTELAPMFDVLKHLDVRVYRKVWNRIRQYWKAEKWIRVTDDEQNLKWVGLNKPITQGEALLQQAQAQGVPPQQLQALAQRIQMDPLMSQVVSTENDIANLDVDMTFQDAPDVASMQIEEFQVLGEMVKSGIPIPPKAIIEASPLPRKDRMLKLMEEGMQIPPQVQEQMKQMQEAGKKLAEENQQLKQQAASKQMEIAADAQADRQALQAQMVADQEKLKSEQMLAVMESRMQAALERFKAELQADTQIEVAQINAKAQAERPQAAAG